MSNTKEKTKNELSRKQKIDDQIKEKLKIAHDLVVSYLIDKYGYTKKSAKDELDIIDSSTRAEMRNIYGKNISNKIGEIEYGQYTRKYPDFFSWYTIVTTVPYYHSLGDTIGYRWEFNDGDINAGPEYTNEIISQFISLGGINDLSIKNWLSSDDTILYIETMKVLLTMPESMDQYGELLREAYISAIPKIENRAPGKTTMNSLETQKHIKWDKLMYDKKAIGNGSAMRSGCIGLFLPGGQNREQLIKMSIECSRITHNSAIAILGSITSALFTAYAIEKLPINLWPHKLMKILKTDVIDLYIKETRPHEYQVFHEDKALFIGQWQKYIDFRFSGINPRLDIRFMQNPVLRYKYLKEKFSYPGSMAGGCADDAVIMAYDALLQCEGVFEKIVVYSILHPGDSDTVGAIALSWYGGYYYSSKNEILFGHYFEELEFREDISDINIQYFWTALDRYYVDIYRHIAKKYIKQIAKK